MITATQAMQHLTDEDTAAMALWEKKIDAALMLYEGRPVLVDFEGSGVRRKVLEKLCEKYREGGWLAQIKSGDQRDPGPWIEFTIASPPRSGPGR
jgi:hypothetical protein